MISLVALKEVAKARLTDSKVLATNDRYDGAIYLCGYALEIALKVKASEVLGRVDFPETSAEFGSRDLKRLKTHSLNLLLQLSGLESIIRANGDCFERFNSVAENWSPESRYRKISEEINRETAFEMVESVESLLAIIFNGVDCE